MNKIQEVRTWPNDATVEAIQGKLKVYEQRTVGTGKTVQNAELIDGSGEKVRLSVWEHPDLKPIDGKEVVLHSNKSGNGRFGGVSVKIGTYKDKPTFELSVSKLGTFQLVEVYKAQNQSVDTNVPTTQPEPVKTQGNGPSGQATVHGATVGMAINQACQNLTHLGHDLTEDDVWRLASRLLRVSKRLEAGDLAPAE